MAKCDKCGDNNATNMVNNEMLCSSCVTGNSKNTKFKGNKITGGFINFGNATVNDKEVKKGWW
jgi:hypothetical protein